MKLPYSLMLFSALLFFGLLLAIQTDVVKDLDRQAVIKVAQLRAPALTGLMKTITFFGTKEFLFPASAITTGLLFFCRSRHFLVFPLSMLLAWFSMEGLKLFFARPRPDFSPLLPESSYSFPSGHAFMGALFFGFLAGLLISRNRPKKQPVLALTGLFLFVLGFTRIYLGVHYPTDVLAGYAGGLFFLGLIRVMNSRK